MWHEGHHHKVWHKTRQNHTLDCACHRMNAMFHIQHHERIGSTNDEARRLAAAGAPHGTVVHADEQAAGRGRFGRTWFSPPGNLYLSVLLRLDLPPAGSSELSFVTALTVADAVDALL